MNEPYQRARRIDKICDAFEASWRDDSLTRIETYLIRDSAAIGEADSSFLDELFDALFPLELELRASVGNLPTLTEMIDRFADRRQRVTQLYRAAVSFLEERQIPKRLGKYSVGRRIGRGSFGTVYQATDTLLDRVVALKVLHPWYGKDSVFVESFRREARAASDLDHPNICLVLDIGEASGRHFYAMQYCDGPSLADHLDNVGPMNAEEVVRTVGQLADALHVAHSRGIIHRDLKPANVMLSEQRDPIITDFGLAHFQAGSDATSSIHAGTPAYAAPEQWRSNRETLGSSAGHGDATPASDIYSLGVLIYELLTNRQPLPAMDHGAIEKMRGELVAVAPRPLANVGLIAMSPDPSDRYQSARTMADALRRLQRTGQSAASGKRVLKAAALVLACLLTIWFSVVWLKPSRYVATESDAWPGDTASMRDAHRNSPSVGDDAADAPVKEALYQVNENRSPPTLEDWIADRSVITVARDGTGDFTTIRAALAELQAHQVVEILDEGPYAEPLAVDGLPPDTGLVSRIGTTVHLSRWNRRAGHQDNPSYDGWKLDELIGFRMSGFHLIAPPSPRRQSHRAVVLSIRGTGAKRLTYPLIVDRCRFSWSESEDWSARSPLDRPEDLVAIHVTTTNNSSPFWLSDCVIDGTALFKTYTPVVVERCLLTSGPARTVLGIQPGLGQLFTLRDSVLVGEEGLRIGFRQRKHYRQEWSEFPRPAYQLKRNYFHTGAAIIVRPPNADAKDSAVTAVELTENVFDTDVGVHFTSPEDFASAQRTWSSGGNLFARFPDKAAATRWQPGPDDRVSPQQIQAYRRMIGLSASNIDPVDHRTGTTNEAQASSVGPRGIPPERMQSFVARWGANTSRRYVSDSVEGDP